MTALSLGYSEAVLGHNSNANSTFTLFLCLIIQCSDVVVSNYVRRYNLCTEDDPNPPKLGVSSKCKKILNAGMKNKHEHHHQKHCSME